MRMNSIEAPELRESGRALVTTSAGIAIGSAWTKPAPAMTADDEKLQQALLSRGPTRGQWLVFDWIVYAAGVACLLAAVFRWFPEGTQ